MRILKSKLAISAFILGSLISCSKDNGSDNNYSGANKTFLTAEGTSTLVIGEDPKQISAKLTLTNAVTTAIEVDLKVTDTNGNATDALVITPNRLEIKAGSREASFSIQLKENITLLEQTRVKINIVPHQTLTTGDDLYITLQPSATIAELTDAQKKLLEGYKANGMDITPFLGKLSVKTKVYSPAGDYSKYFTEAFEKTFEGKTIITLSEQATASKPVLKMTENPMGAVEFFYDVLRKNTVEDDEYFLKLPLSPRLMELITWNKDSQETFSATLDGIEVENPQGNISNLNYVHEFTNYNNDTYNLVPFIFEFSAWNRLKKLIDENNTEAKEYHAQGSTSYPNFFINNSSIDTDELGGGAFVPTTGSIDFAKGIMKFTFLSYHSLSGDYLKFEVEYNLNN
ncbi:MAG: DUF4929 family protein [Capnocytophaga sp.]|nr:DUF4929 family protein [Capnocytophaga sp.]